MQSKKVGAKLLTLLLCACLPPSLSLGDSWSQINQGLEISEDWQLIVKDSAFRLGAQREATLGDRL